MNKFTIAFGALVGITALLSYWLEPEKKGTAPSCKRDPANGFDVTRSRMGDGTEVVRFRGSYRDIMNTLSPGWEPPAPPLPQDLDVDSLPSYQGGCPHCGKMSMMGENTWHYQELARTRGYLDNTTTYLAKCKTCGGFMKSTVDHDDF